MKFDKLNSAESRAYKLNPERTSYFLKKKINYLVKKEATSPMYVIQFGLYLDDKGLLRCKGRADNATFSSTNKHPYSLPPNHKFSNLLILHIHSKIKQSGTRDTLATLRILDSE